MMKYINGLIYKIEPVCEHDENEVYYGSTESPLCVRMDRHKGNYKLWKKGNSNLVYSFKLFDKYGLENCEISLMERVKAKDKDELKAREAYYIRNNRCINRNIPGRTGKQYNTDNRDTRLANSKRYHVENRDVILARQKRYHVENRSTISARKLAKVKCEVCQCLISRCYLRSHERSQKHQNNLLLCTDITEYEFYWDDGTPCTKQEYEQAML